MALNYLFIFCQLSRKRPPLPGGGEDSAYEKGGGMLVRNFELNP